MRAKPGVGVVTSQDLYAAYVVPTGEPMHSRMEPSRAFAGGAGGTVLQCHNFQGHAWDSPWSHGAFPTFTPVSGVDSSVDVTGNCSDPTVRRS